MRHGCYQFFKRKERFVYLKGLRMQAKRMLDPRPDIDPEDPKDPKDPKDPEENNLKCMSDNEEI